MRRRGDRVRVVGDEMGGDLGGLLCVHRRQLAGLSDGLFDGRVLTVTLVGVSNVLCWNIEKDIHVGEWNISASEGGWWDDIYVLEGSFAHVDVKLLHFFHWKTVSFDSVAHQGPYNHMVESALGTAS